MNLGGILNYGESYIDENHFQKHKNKKYTNSNCGDILCNKIIPNNIFIDNKFDYRDLYTNNSPVASNDNFNNISASDYKLIYNINNNLLNAIMDK